LNNREKQILALRTAVIAGIFSMIVCLILILNFWQLQQTDPLESELLKSLVERLKDDTGNEALKEEIRRLDLMARNAYFTKQWQIRTGAYLLIAGIVVSMIALRIFYSIKAKIEEPDITESRLDLEMLISRRWILYSVLLIFSIALFAAFFSVDHLSRIYSLTEVQEEKEELPVQEIIVSREDESYSEELSSEEEGIEKEAESITGIDEDAVTEADEVVEKNGISTVSTGKKITGNFPAFRGPNGLGITRQKNTPVDWDGASGRNIIWKSAIPYSGYNSPVIWGDHLFLTGANNNEQFVFCYNANTGKLIWQHPVNDIARPAGNLSKPTDDTGYAAPTVTTDGRRVYAIFASGDIASVSMDNKRIWAKNIGIPDNHYGHSSSLLLWQGLVVVQFDTNESGKVLALDANTGAQKWETMRNTKISWASPILANVGDHVELILSSSPLVAGYDPNTGKELWGMECLSGEVGPSPAFSDGIVFAANEYAALVAIKPSKDPDILWETNEYLPEVASPVADNGMVFIATSYGVIACFDATNGELLWEYEADQGFYASPVIADDKIYFLDLDGIMHIFKKDKTMQLLGKPALGEQSVCTPAFANGRIYLRSMDTLYCIGNK